MFTFMMGRSNTAVRRDEDEFGYRFYRILNQAQPNSSMSLAEQSRENEVILMTRIYPPSENWLLFFQEGRYFIRNYVYYGGFQIGLDSKNSTQPKLLVHRGDLGQQWILTKTGDGDGNTKRWTFTNGLLGNDTYLGLDGTKLLMTRDKSKATVWDLELNESAGTPQIGSSMIESVRNMEVSQCFVKYTLKT